ncbi:hypothetical protein NUW58_g8295 [Xylaria curta]|uniref:Uncharacterized protein n=1 Tax=Xylaria curta TaxID=42375 RepID=A0ACC1N8M6_9PEZI|nr:hypothetical protein NUW58_g8295 [Xylaria curta]
MCDTCASLDWGGWVGRGLSVLSAQLAQSPPNMSRSMLFHAHVTLLQAVCLSMGLQLAGADDLAPRSAPVPSAEPRTVSYASANRVRTECEHREGYRRVADQVTREWLEWLEWAHLGHSYCRVDDGLTRRTLTGEGMPSCNT